MLYARLRETSSRESRIKLTAILFKVSLVIINDSS